eukprot:5909883-Lingulodinium_polyedra.AAC.1
MVLARWRCVAHPGRGDQFQRCIPRPEALGRRHGQRSAENGQGIEEVCALLPRPRHPGGRR